MVLLGSYPMLSSVEPVEACSLLQDDPGTFESLCSGVMLFNPQYAAEGKNRALD